MTDYAPTEFIKGDRRKTARTWSEHYALVFDGWKVYGAGAVRQPSSIAATQADLERLKAVMRSQNPNTFGSAAKLGPVSTDFTSVNMNVAGDAGTYNRQYALGAGGLSPLVGGQVPAGWPADMGAGVHAYSGNFHLSISTQNFGPRSLRVMCNGDKFCWYAGAGGYDYMVYIDGRPTSLTPYLPGNNAAHFCTILFPSKKVREIEIRTMHGIQAVYTQKPYDLWRPAPARGPRVLIMGDSFTSTAGITPVTNTLDAMYWNIGPHIGSDDVWLDHVGGTGYGVTSAADGSGIGNRYLDRYTKDWGGGAVWNVQTINPEMVVVHGGGANDKYKGRTNAQVIADVVTHFKNLRERLPHARLVFVEGFAPPIGFSTFNPDYIAIRQGAQAALQGVGVYYIDVATTNPWIKGTGYNSTGDATEISYSTISADGVHPNAEGHRYLRGRLAPKLKRILADDGSLLNTLL